MAKKVIGIYAGSFDPPTWGHVSIVERALNFCDELIIAIGISTSKKNLFSPEERKVFWQDICKKRRNVRVLTFDGLTAQLAEKEGARVLIRGLRSSNDLAREMEISAANHALNEKLETVFLSALPPFAFHSSTIVREIAHFNPDVDLSQYVPSIVHKQLKKKMKN